MISCALCANTVLQTLSRLYNPTFSPKRACSARPLFSRNFVISRLRLLDFVLGVWYVLKVIMGGISSALFAENPFKSIPLSVGRTGCISVGLAV